MPKIYVQLTLTCLCVHIQRGHLPPQFDFFTVKTILTMEMLNDVLETLENEQETVVAEFDSTEGEEAGEMEESDEMEEAGEEAEDDVDGTEEDGEEEAGEEAEEEATEEATEEA